jgi:disulfide bond formation protein DsbB
MMRVPHRTALFICLAAAPLLIVCGTISGAARPSEAPAADATGAPAGNPAGDADRGQRAFGDTCANCHGDDAKGMPFLGKDLTRSEFVRGLSDAELVEFVQEGRPINDPLNTTGVPMPPRGGNPTLSDQDLADIVAYIRTLEE